MVSSRVFHWDNWFASKFFSVIVGKIWADKRFFKQNRRKNVKFLNFDPKISKKWETFFQLGHSDNWKARVLTNFELQHASLWSIFWLWKWAILQSQSFSSDMLTKVVNECIKPLLNMFFELLAKFPIDLHSLFLFFRPLNNVVVTFY